MILRDYQLDIASKACDLLRTIGIAYLSMEVRTGKTATALSAADLFGAKRVLFVTKKKAVYSIDMDYAKLMPNFELKTTNYEQLHNLLYKADLVIVDEAHSLGQYPKPSERTKALKEYCKGLPIIFLSGTPTPESYSQLFHQLWISSYSPFCQYPNFYKWAADHVHVKQRYFGNRPSNDYSNADKDKIYKMTCNLFLTYTQEEAGFAQVIEEEVLTVKMAPTTYALAERLIKDRVYIGHSGAEIVADTEVKLQQKLHQVYTGSVIPEGEGDAICFDLNKVNFIKEHFAGQKIAVFYKFRGELEMLKRVFLGRLTEDPALFNASSHSRVFASQIQSGREGINLSTADALVMLNIDFAAVSYWQARARMQVKDRTTPARLFWIFAENGIEHKIYQSVLNKKDYTLSHFRKDYSLNKKAAA